MEDKTLSCRDCGNEFVFAVSEQEFFAQKGFTNTPSRCPECRAARKARRGDTGTGAGMGGSRGREMFAVVCAECGKDTQVPFEPRSDRPVYCSDCYSARRPSTGAGRTGGRGGRW